MRFRVIIVIVWLLHTLLLMGQNLPLQTGKPDGIKVPDNISSEFSRLKKIRLQEPGDELNQSYIHLFKAIPYLNIRKYSVDINDAYEYSLSAKDSLFYLESLRINALLLYQQRNYSSSIEKFNEYFILNQSILKSDTNYAFEYSKYASCYKNTNQIEEYISTIDSGIRTAQKRVHSNNDLALFYIQLGNYKSGERELDTARILLDKALYLAQNAKTKDYQIISSAKKTKAFLELLSNNIETAIILYDEAMEALLMTEHTNIEIATLYKNKAMAFLVNDEFVEAIKQFKMALHIYQLELDPEHPSIANIFRYLGLSYYNSGDFENAIFNYKKSLKIDPSPKNYFSIRNLANAYSRVDEIHKADSLYQLCLNYLIESKGKNNYQTNMTYLSYGQFLVEKNIDLNKGENYLCQSIEFRYKHYNGRDIDICEPLNILGAYYLENNQVDRGIDSLQSSLLCAVGEFNNLNIYSNPFKNQINNNPFLNNTLAWKAYGMYLKYLQTNNLKDLKMAHQTYKLYIYATKEMRKYYDEIESSFKSKEIHYVFNQAIDVAYLLYLETKDELIIDDIFSFIEGKKAFTLLNSLNVLEQKKLLKVPKELLNKELELKYQMGIINEKINIEENNANSADSLINFDKKAFELSRSLDSIQTIYKKEYSGFYQLKYGFKELRLAEIKEKTPETIAFINYSLSDTILNILCITKEETKLISRNIDSSFYKHIQSMVQLLKNVDTDNSYVEFVAFVKASRALYNSLILPVEDQINGKELIIIPDGMLNYISFDALLSEEVDIKRPDYRLLPYLIRKHKSNIANSMQVYFNMKIRTRDLKKEVYAFAPSYEEQNISQDSLASEYRFLRPLDYAVHETQAINRYLPTKAFIGKEASEENFQHEAKNAGVLHLAMHTLLNDKNPMYSKLLFSYDKESHSGLVNTYELLTMDLNAELAVLSGCSTGEGELQKGEGVMSLSAGFQYAGVPAIVMSLWEVNDRFGALVVDKFYYYLSEGMAKNKALHLAKIEVLSQGNALYAHPYYWAGLILMGEDAKLQFQARNKIDIYLIVSSGLLLLIILGLTYRKKWAA